MGIKTVALTRRVRWNGICFYVLLYGANFCGVLRTNMCFPQNGGVRSAIQNEKSRQCFAVHRSVTT